MKKKIAKMWLKNEKKCRNRVLQLCKTLKPSVAS